MIRDFDEFGARPLRGPGCFRRPPADVELLDDLVKCHGEARQLVRNAEIVFYDRSIRAGLRMIWENLARVESHDIEVQAYMIAYHLRALSCYGPVERSIRFARRSLRFLPDRGRRTAMRAVALGELAHLYLRQGNRRGAWRCCDEILRMERTVDVAGAIGSARLRRSQVMRLDGDLAEALDEAEKAATLTRADALHWLPKARYVALNLAQLREDLGQRKEAHEAYRWTTEILDDTGYATRAEHEAAWDGYHRTK
jgi:tetratricopeptide (TPR) repeat protein